MFGAEREEKKEIWTPSKIMDDPSPQIKHDNPTATRKTFLQSPKKP